MILVQISIRNFLWCRRGRAMLRRSGQRRRINQFCLDLRSGADCAPGRRQPLIACEGMLLYLNNCAWAEALAPEITCDCNRSRNDFILQACFLNLSRGMFYTASLLCTTGRRTLEEYE